MTQLKTFAMAVAVGLGSACVSSPSSVPSGPAISSSPAVCAAARPTVSGFGFTVRDLPAAERFFVETLGAAVVGRREADGEELAALTGLDHPSARAVIVTVGAERVTLTRYRDAGRPGRSDAVSNDLDFQHLALVVSDIDAAHARVTEAGARAASRGGPQRIPDSNVSAAGIRAFYFRDREGHPLELIWFPSDKGDPRWQARRGPLFLGIDHSAIAVASTEESLAFYRDLIGLEVAGESFNEGVEQARLSAVAGARVRITGLRGTTGPGVEFLEYVAPGPGRARPAASTPNDAFHWETSVVVTDLDRMQACLRAAGVPIVSTRAARCGLCLERGRALLVRDPDGHVLRLIENRSKS